jgi:hypothetical protein
MDNQELFRTLQGVEAELYYRIDKENYSGLPSDKTNDIYSHINNALLMLAEAMNKTVF